MKKLIDEKFYFTKFYAFKILIIKSMYIMKLNLNYFLLLVLTIHLESL